MSWLTHIVAAAGYVFDNKGNILIVKTYHRGWDTPGG
ncbi:NUDIX hydrolase [Fusibacter sp. A1]|nr:NUDIX hydrolase [Fusibacter sp. A1]